MNMRYAGAISRCASKRKFTCTTRQRKELTNFHARYTQQHNNSHMTHVHSHAQRNAKNPSTYAWVRTDRKVGEAAEEQGAAREFAQLRLGFVEVRCGVYIHRRRRHRGPWKIRTHAYFECFVTTKAREHIPVLANASCVNSIRVLVTLVVMLAAGVDGPRLNSRSMAFCGRHRYAPRQQ